ncbi:MAG: thioredoxin [Thomasclavelia sp.]|nr:thioredoxin [Thomasclavelia sp.]
MEFINESNFDEKTSKGIVLVDFTADWCGYCKMIAPVLEELQKEMTNVVFYKINADENMNILQKYGIMGLPHLMIFKDGNIAKEISGAVPKQQIKDTLEAI